MGQGADLCYSVRDASGGLSCVSQASGDVHPVTLWDGPSPSMAL